MSSSFPFVEIFTPRYIAEEDGFILFQGGGRAEVGSSFGNERIQHFSKFISAPTAFWYTSKIAAIALSGSQDFIRTAKSSI